MKEDTVTEFVSTGSHTDASYMSRSSLRGEDKDYYRKLILTLDPNPFFEVSMRDVIERFKKNDFSVEIEPVLSQRDSYIVVFANKESAEKALAKCTDIGYKLKKKRLPRASPKYPVLFRACHDLVIRAGKSLKSEVIGLLSKGDVVFVDQVKRNQVKRNRARLALPRNGWVSISNRGDIWFKQLVTPYNLIYNGSIRTGSQERFGN